MLTDVHVLSGASHLQIKQPQGLQFSHPHCTHAGLSEARLDTVPGAVGSGLQATSPVPSWGPSSVPLWARPVVTQAEESARHLSGITGQRAEKAPNVKL